MNIDQIEEEQLKISNDLSKIKKVKLYSHINHAYIEHKTKKQPFWIKQQNRTKLFKKIKKLVLTGINFTKVGK